MSEEKSIKIPNIFLAFVFTLLIKNSTTVNYNDNKREILEFVDEAIRGKFLPLNQFNGEKNRYLKQDIYEEFVSLEIRDKLIEDNFKKYLLDCSTDNIESCDEQPITWSKQIKNFEKSIDKEAIPSNIIIHSTEHIAVIAKRYFDGNLDVKNPVFYIDNAGNKDNPLYIHNEEENELQFNNKFHDYRFSCILDLTKNDKDLKNSEIKTTITMEDEILEEIDKLVKRKGAGQEILFDELIKIYNTVAKKRKKSTKPHNLDKLIKNHISSYRTNKATSLTLSRMYTSSYSYYLIKKKSSNNL